MTRFWDNIKKFPKFIFSVITGFFLTTFYTIFELLKREKKRQIISIIITILISMIILTLRQMLDIN
uniref:hypothetical protein n=1 Tax=Gracilaria urvillei TaxID=172974 RepID=UPI001D121191|nr:hypothetical protein LK147_pgp029 [Hydropuntia urvillei]UAD88511.1 hypothetical protein [Hydropuntia urvillei]